MAFDEDLDSSDSETWSSEEDESSFAIEVGTTFFTPSDALHAIQDHALAQGKSVRVSSHGGADRKIVCTSPLCKFFVRLYRRSKVVNKKRQWGLWYISSMNLIHSDCMGVAKPTERQIARLALFAGALKGPAQPPVRTLIGQIHEAHHIPLENKKRKVYRAMARVREDTDVDALRSFGLIEPYLTAFAELNPGTVAVAEKDEASRFKRYAVVVGASVRAATGCQRVVGIDCSHSKSKYFSGVQMHLVGRDGNMKNITIAFGIVPAEDLDSYNWFFDLVAKAGYDMSEIPVFCDRHVATLAAAESRGFHLRFCTLHIMRNIAHKFGALSKQDKNLLWSIQGSETVDEYRGRLEVLKIARGEGVRNYVLGIDPKKWCLFANIKHKALYGWRTSNFVESVFGSQLVSGVRRLHPYAFLKSMCEKLMGDFYVRASDAAVWVSRGSKVTPGAMAIYNKEAARIGEYVVMRSSKEESYVASKSAYPRLLRRVMFSDHECSCAFMDQNGIPCRHFIAALADREVEEDVPTYFHSYYTVAAYMQAFGEASIRIPLDQELRVDPSWLPPLVKKQHGRSRTKRIRSSGE